MFSSGMTITDYLSVKHGGQSGGKQIWGTVPEFAQRDWGKSQQTPISESGFHVGMRRLPNIKQNINETGPLALIHSLFKDYITSLTFVLKSIHISEKI